MKLTIQKINGTKKTIFPDKIIFTKKGVMIKKGNNITSLKDTIVEILTVE